MKKYFTLILIAAFSFAAVSCTDRNDDVIVTDNDTYSMVLEITNANFVNTAPSGYNISATFTKPLFNEDIVLIFRKAGTDNGATVWQSIPRSIYIDATKRFDYDYDFSKNDIKIYAAGNYDISTNPEYLNNQTFRVVLVPAGKGNKNANVDYTDYNSVIKYFKIDDSKVKNL